jgi:transducin (beta)-like 1
MQLGVFGPVGHDVPLQQHAEEHEQSQDEDAPGDEDEEPLPPVVDAENARKRPSDRPQQPQLNGGSPAKRPRLSNGYENGAHAATADPMDLDGQNHHHGTENNHAYPSPLEGEQAPTPTLRTDGPDQATQIEKVEELASKTVFIPLGSGDASVLSPPTTSPKLAGENASVLLHCQWNPRDPSILAGAGSEALARVWTVSRATAALAGQDPASHGHVPDGDVSPPFHSLVEGDVSPRATVTAMAWNGDGTALAIATDGDLKGRISLWNADGTHITHFEVPESPVYKLRWSPNNAAILGINPDKDDMLVTVYSAATSNTVSFPVPVSGFAQEDKGLDVAWTSDNEFLLAGGELLSLMQCSETNITIVKKFETRGGDSISHVRYNEKAQLAATCDRKGFVDVSHAPPAP